MRKSLTGTGSTLILLVFTVLCLTIFMFISLSSARIDKTMAEVEARMVTGYYGADLLAEYILADMQETPPELLPESIRGIDILLLDGGEVSFSCPISDIMELYVKAVLIEDSYEILEWRMRNTDEWEVDFELPVWSGD